MPVLPAPVPASAAPASAPRLSSAAPVGEAGARMTRRGGRFFVVRGSGDRVVTLPDAAGPLGVVVPRGFGHPLIATRTAAGFRAEPTGEPCAPARWASAGGIAAWLRRVPTPRGPVHAVERAVEPAENAGLWVCVRPTALDWAAVRWMDASAGHGPVAVADRWIRGVSPTARARGVRRGMSLALARRRCPELRVVAAPPQEALRERLVSVLSGDYGPVETRRGAFLLRLPHLWSGAPAGLASGERIAQRLWQALGVEVRVGIAESQADASGLARMLDPGWVGVAPAEAGGVWSASGKASGSWVRGERAAAWRGEAMPDIEGAVELCRGLAAPLGLAEDDTCLHLTLVGTRSTVRLVREVPTGCDRAALYGLIDGAVRGPLLAAGAVVAVRIRLRPAAPGGARGAMAPGPRVAATPDRARRLALIGDVR